MTSTTMVENCTDWKWINIASIFAIFHQKKRKRREKEKEREKKLSAIDQKTFDVILKIQVNKLAWTWRYKRKKLLSRKIKKWNNIQLKLYEHNSNGFVIASHTKLCHQTTIHNRWTTLKSKWIEDERNRWRKRERDKKCILIYVYAE